MGYGSVKDIIEFWNAIKEYKPMKIVLTVSVIVVIIMFFATGVLHIIKSNRGEHSEWLWSKSNHKPDTVFNSSNTKTETPIVVKPNVINPTEINTKKKSKVQQNSLSSVKSENTTPTVEFKAPVTGSAFQIGGSGNTQTNNFGLKPREVTKEIIDLIQSKITNSTTYISIATRSADSESRQFAAKIADTFTNLGYRVQMNGIVNDMIIGPDHAQTAKHQSSISITHENGVLQIVLPTNQ